MILLSFTESCKWALVEVGSLFMGAMYGLLDFESDRNSFAVIGSFAFSIPSVPSYPERFTVLKLYSLQRRRERYVVIYVWKILIIEPEEEHVLHLTFVLEDLEH